MADEPKDKNPGDSKDEPGAQDKKSTTGEMTMESLKQELEAVRKEAAKYRTSLRTVEKEKEEAEKKNLEDQGKFKELYEKTLNDYTALQAKFELTERNFHDTDSKLNIYLKAEDEKRLSLLNELPEDLREDFKDANFQQLTKLKSNLAVRNENANSPVMPPNNLKAGEIKPEIKPDIPFQRGSLTSIIDKLSGRKI